MTVVLPAGPCYRVATCGRSQGVDLQIVFQEGLRVDVDLLDAVGMEETTKVKRTKRGKLGTVKTKPEGAPKAVGDDIVDELLADGARGGYALKDLQEKLQELCDKATVERDAAALGRLKDVQRLLTSADTALAADPGVCVRVCVCLCVCVCVCLCVSLAVCLCLQATALCLRWTMAVACQSGSGTARSVCVLAKSSTLETLHHTRPHGT